MGRRCAVDIVVDVAVVGEEKERSRETTSST
jgi:hypothetical protein